MSDPDVISLLKEIRDLQREHIDSYRDYLARYEAKAAEQTARATRLIRLGLLLMLMLGGALGLCVAYVAMRIVTCPAFTG